MTTFYSTHRKTHLHNNEFEANFTWCELMFSFQAHVMFTSMHISHWGLYFHTDSHTDYIEDDNDINDIHFYWTEAGCFLLSYIPMMTTL